MGIQGLSTFLRTKAPAAIKPYAQSESARAAVDMTLYLVRFFYGDPSIEAPEALARAYCDFDRSLRRRGIEPVHVMDGPPSPLKRFAHAKRSEQREATRDQLNALRGQMAEIEARAEAAAAAALAAPEIKIKRPRTDDAFSQA